jgi:hypothetical protein
MRRQLVTRMQSVIELRRSKQMSNNYAATYLVLADGVVALPNENAATRAGKFLQWSVDGLTLANVAGSGGDVNSVNGQVGTVVLTAGDIGAQPLDADLTALAALTGTNNIYYRSGANAWSSVTIGSGLSFSGGTLATSGGGGGGDALTSNPLSQFAATTSAQLASIITNETGTGSLVFNNSPTLVTPVLGVATATSINGTSIPAGVTLLKAGDVGTSVQGQSANLQAIAGLTISTDKLPYFSGASSAALTDFTGAARTFVAAVSASAQTALLSTMVGDAGSGGTKGLVPAPGAGDAAKVLSGAGTWIAQTALSQALTNIAQTTPAGDTIAYNSGSSTGALTAFTSTGRAVAGASSQASARSVIGACQANNATSAIVDLGSGVADSVAYYTGAASAALMTVTTPARELLDDANFPAMRTTLGLAIGTDVQAHSSRLTDLNTILVTPLASASQAAVTGTAGASYTSTEQAMLNNLKALVNQLRADLVTARIIKGSA